MIRDALERRLVAVASPLVDRIDRAAARWILGRPTLPRELVQQLLERLAGRLPGTKLEMQDLA